MLFSKTKKNIMTVQLISCIIINFLKLRELHTKIMSSKLINKVTIIKDLSSLTYDILTFNIFSFITTAIPLYRKLKRYLKKFVVK
jgi:hypothetical protein